MVQGSRLVSIVSKVEIDTPAMVTEAQTLIDLLASSFEHVAAKCNGSCPKLFRLKRS